jgi:hypothetical protein
MTKQNYTLAELVNLLHQAFRWPAPSDVRIDAGNTKVVFTLGYRRYVATGNLDVCERAESRCNFQSIHSNWVQQRLIKASQEVACHPSK